MGPCVLFERHCCCLSIWYPGTLENSEYHVWVEGVNEIQQLCRTWACWFAVPSKRENWSDPQRFVLAQSCFGMMLKSEYLYLYHICIRNLSFLLGMLPVTVTTKDDIRTSLVQVGLPKSLYFLLPSWEWWLVSPMFAPKFFKSSIFTSILGWRDEGIDPPTLTARRWWLGAGRSDPWELGSFKKCWGWGPNLFTKKPGAVFEAQPDSGRKAGGKTKHPNWNRNFELWTMFFFWDETFLLFTSCI